MEEAQDMSRDPGLDERVRRHDESASAGSWQAEADAREEKGRSPKAPAVEGNAHERAVRSLGSADYGRAGAARIGLAGVWAALGRCTGSVAAYSPVWCATPAGRILWGLGASTVPLSEPGLSVALAVARCIEGRSPFGSAPATRAGLWCARARIGDDQAGRGRRWGIARLVDRPVKPGAMGTA